MKLAHDLSRAGIVSADRALKRLGAVSQLLQVGITGKTAGWHVGLLSVSVIAFINDAHSFAVGKETENGHLPCVPRG
jgi:hypothetical protein